MHALRRGDDVYGMARVLNCKRHTALGVLVDWLIYIDEQTVDGNTKLLPKEVDDVIGFRGCAEALFSINWALLDEDGFVRAKNFGKHCGDSAKARSEHALRQASYRSRKKSAASDGDVFLSQGGDKIVSQGGDNFASPDKTRLEYTTTTTTARAREGVALPSSPEQVAKFMSGLPNGLKGEELAKCAERFFLKNEESGWITKNGFPIQNWHSSARLFAQAWLVNLSARSSDNNKPSDDYSLSLY